MSKPTIVTMYFNLKELADSSKETRSIDFYLTHGRGTLQLEYPMVIFCDTITKPLLQALRNELVDSKMCPTVYVERNLSDYDFYKQWWPVISENRKKSNMSWYNNPEERNTASYLLVCMFKMVAIQLANQRNDFDSSYYFWLDFGCSHIAKNNMKEATIKMLEHPNPKISTLYIDYCCKKTLENMERVVNYGMCGIAGTVFSAQKEYIPVFCAYMWSIFYEMVARGVGHTDEQVFTYCYDRHPELFTLYFGDYYSVILNYHYVCKDSLTIKDFFIVKTINAGRHDLAKLAAKSILDGYEKQTSDLPECELEFMRSIVNS